MILIIQRRAEIALRSLQTVEQKQINRAIHELLATDRAELQGNPKFHALQSVRSEKKLFAYKGSQKLRLVISFVNDTCVLQDIVDHDRLGNLVNREGQE